jgi:NADH:ubiquinone oxidoreductase subunit E
MKALTTLTPSQPVVVRERSLPRPICRVVICTCPVCHIMGSTRLLRAFAVYAGVLHDHARKDISLKIQREKLPGACTSGPNITVNGKRMNRVRPADVCGIIRDVVIEAAEA